MTPSLFLSWMKSLSLSTTAAALTLGTTRRTIERRLAGRVEIGRETALACAAVAAGLGVWKREGKSKAGKAKPVPPPTFEMVEGVGRPVSRGVWK